MSWNDIIGLGVAGNFTGHLEQAGEASDFKNVRVAEAGAPKGIFPFYIPRANAKDPLEHFLHQMPVSSEMIRLNDLTENHQIEPEVALLCDLTYEDGVVTAISPRYAMAHNDCSIRRHGARKISEKKNWGPDSKGTSDQRIAIDRFASGGVLDRYRLTCFLRRDGVLHDYGVDSPLTGYSYFYERLMGWLVTRVNTQIDEGPLEDIPGWLAAADYPSQALISIGATRYTEFGEANFLQPGDESVVVLYNSDLYGEADVPSLIDDPDVSDRVGLSILHQTVVAP